MKALLRSLAFLAVIAIYHPPVAHAEETSPASNAAASELTESESRLFYNPETGRIVRVASDGAIIDVDPSTVRIRDLRAEAVASDDSESLAHRYRHHRHHHHHRHYHRHRHYGRYYGYYGGYGAGRAFGMFLGGLFYYAVNPCSPFRYNPWYCWY